VALNPTQLSSDLEDVFASLPASASDAADALALAYGTYAAGGQFGASMPNIPPANVDALAAALLAAIAVPAAGNPATIAASWAAGLTAFWLGVPVAGVPAGATVGCPGAASLVATLTAVFANVANTSASCAAGLSAALHGATITVTAAVAPPPGTVLPIA